MKRGLVILFGVLMVLPTNAWGGGKAGKAPTDGTWAPVEAQLGEQKLPEASLKSMRLTIKGETYVVTIGDKVDKGTVKLDAKKKPMTLDILGTDGPNKGKKILAIIEVKGDTMRVCYDLGGKSRPTEFAANGTNGPLFLITYKLEKK